VFGGNPACFLAKATFSHEELAGCAWACQPDNTPRLAINRVERKEVGPDPRLSRSGRPSGFPQPHGSGPTPSTLIRQARNATWIPKEAERQAASFLVQRADDSPDEVSEVGMLASR
jgi:hypothetical protein